MKNRYFLFAIMLVLFSTVMAQEEKPELSLQLGFHTINNKIPYLMASTRLKKDNSFQIVEGARIKVYFKEEADAYLLGEAVTDHRGFAKFVLPPAMKSAWDSSAAYPFIAVAAEAKDYAVTRTEIQMSRARIVVDTTLNEEGKRAVLVKVEQFDGTGWTAASEVEVKVGVRRAASVLPVSEEESYTTDSLGTVTAEFMRDSLPTENKKGELLLAVSIEDNDIFGNLVVERSVPWGVYQKPVSNLGRRTLWSTSDRAPYWLLFMALTIIAVVWGVIFYLVYLFIRIKRSGSTTSVPKADKLPVQMVTSID
jgi:hypothetical protein